MGQARAREKSRNARHARAPRALCIASVTEVDLPAGGKARGVAFPYRVDAEDHGVWHLLPSEGVSQGILARDPIEEGKDERPWADVGAHIPDSLFKLVGFHAHDDEVGLSTILGSDERKTLPHAVQEKAFLPIPLQPTHRGKDADRGGVMVCDDAGHSGADCSRRPQ